MDSPNLGEEQVVGGGHKAIHDDATAAQVGVMAEELKMAVEAVWFLW